MLTVRFFYGKYQPVPQNSRGRPLKFGRPARLVALTLPEDVVRWLHGIHPDPAWAIVSLHESGIRGSRRRHPRPGAVPGLAQLPGRRALIVVDPHSCRNLSGVSVIPMGTDRAFLALEGDRGLADLELAILDRLDDPRVAAEERQGLRRFRTQLRDWRRSSRLRFSTRSIILVEENRRGARSPRKPGRRSRSSTAR
jgi:hypothetical protein